MQDMLIVSDGGISAHAFSDPRGDYPMRQAVSDSKLGEITTPQ